VAPARPRHRPHPLPTARPVVLVLIISALPLGAIVCGVSLF
jgi:hypothetical protein